MGVESAKGGERTETDRARQPPDRCWTIGHSSLQLEPFLDTLAAHGIEQVADVRRYPASQRHPHFNRETLATVLGARGVAYRWFEPLGGRRPGRKPAASPNRGLTAPGFRQYADYMLEPEFGAALAELAGWLGGRRTAILCAEALWWRCHRRLIADRLVADGIDVHHIFDPRKAEPHALWDLAVRKGAGLVYPPVQGELGLPENG